MKKNVTSIKFIPYYEVKQHANIENESSNLNKSCKCSDFALNNLQVISFKLGGNIIFISCAKM